MIKKFLLTSIIILTGFIIGLGMGSGEVSAATVYVKVTTGNGNPMNDMRVDLFNSAGRIVDYRHTGRDGIAGFNVGAGTYYARTYSHMTGYSNGTVTVGSEGKATLYIKYALVRVKVTTGNGDPVSGIDVDLFREDGSRAAYSGTGRDGLVGFHVQPGTYKARSYTYMTGYSNGTVTVGPEETATLYIKYARVLVKVTTGNGDPIYDVRVNLYRPDGSLAAYRHTGKDGIAGFHLRPGNYTARVSKSSTIYSNFIEVGPEEEATIYIKFARVRVVVTTGNGDPVPEVRVHLHSSNGNIIDYRHAGRDGITGFHVKPGSYFAIARGEMVLRSNDTVTLGPEGDGTLYIKYGRIKVLVLDDFGNPVAGSKLNLYTSGGGYVRYRFSGADGTNSFSERPGCYYISTNVNGRPVQSPTVCVAGEEEKLVIINSPNKPPIAVASADPSTAYVGEQISFSSEGSYDPDGEIASYHWDFGDGTTSYLANPEHAYSEPGNYTASLVVGDDMGLQSGEEKISLEVIIDDEPPTLNIASPTEGQIVPTELTEISGSAWDRVGVSKIEVSINYRPFELASGTTEWTYSGNLFRETNTIRVRATDLSGNTAIETVEVYHLNPEDYIPYYYFSKGEKYHPTSFYFDDTNLLNNHENYDARTGSWDSSDIYVNTVEDETYFTIQYWLYYAHNPWGGKWLSHEHDWEAVHLVFEKNNLGEPFEVRYAHHINVNSERWGRVQKIDNHPIVYVANDSHASYPSKEKVSPIDIWKENSKLTPSEFNLILVQELDVEFWPKYFSGEDGYIYRLPEVPESYEKAPWIRDSWNMTQPNPPEFSDLKEFLNNTFILGVLGPVDLHLYDSKGRHVGLNYSTGEADIRIPDAIFYSDEEGQIIVIPESSESAYLTEIIAFKNGSYDFGAFQTVDRAFVFKKEYDNISTSKGDLHVYTLTPSIVSVDKEFKPNLISLKRKGSIQPRIEVANKVLLNISRIDITDYLLPDWIIKNKNSLSYSILIDESEYGLQFKNVEKGVNGDTINITFNFAEGIEITDENGNWKKIYKFEPNWTLIMKYPMHPPKQIESGQKTAEIKVKVTTFPLFGYPNGISTIISNRAELEVR